MLIGEACFEPAMQLSNQWRTNSFRAPELHLIIFNFNKVFGNILFIDVELPNLLVFSIIAQVYFEDFFYT